MALDICLEVLEIFILPRNLCLTSMGQKASFEAETLWMVPSMTWEAFLAGGRPHGGLLSRALWVPGTLLFSVASLRAS